MSSIAVAESIDDAKPEERRLRLGWAAYEAHRAWALATHQRSVPEPWNTLDREAREGWEAVAAGVEEAAHLGEMAMAIGGPRLAGSRVGPRQDRLYALEDAGWIKSKYFPEDREDGWVVTPKGEAELRAYWGDR